jgi:poly-beta-1,6-N-acetyl-D-glucosamine N-deacetylase
MKLLYKFLKIISLIAIAFMIIWLIVDKAMVEDKPAMTFPKPLEKDGCLVLTYHRVREDKISTKVIESLTNSSELKHYSVYKSEFEKHIQTLVQNNATFVTPKQIREFREKGSFPKNCVMVTFDDVDKSVYENAFPILKKYKVPFTIFIIAGQVGNKDFNNLPLASWDEIKEMVDSGLVNVGSHTYDMHYLKGDDPVFFDLKDKDDFLKDLIKSKNTIEAKLKGIEVLDFAYPYGNGKDDLKPIIKEAGFLSAYILAPRIIDKDNAPYWQNRILVDHKVFNKVVKPWVKN